MMQIVSNKDRYRILCNEKDIPLFMQAWWMDAVCESNGKYWDVLFVEENGRILAAMPYHIIVKFGLKIVVQPVLTQYSGIWIDYPENQTTYQRLSFEKKLFTHIIDLIESNNLSLFNQCFHHSVTNWLPFYWKNYKQTTRYTYIIPNISDIDQVFQKFTYAKQKQIRKAEKSLEISFSLSPEEFYEHQCKTLATKGKRNILQRRTVLNCCYKAIEREQGIIVAAIDSDKAIHAAIFVVFDKNSAYNLISTIDPEFASSGGSTLVVWAAIKHLSNKTFSFDFEGSMIEYVENSFRQFGTEQVPFFEIEKSNKMFQLIYNLYNGYKSGFRN